MTAPLAAAELSQEPGAYALVIALDAPLVLDIPRFAGCVLPPGTYVYCGSAYGPGGLRARIGRHLRSTKAARWHVDRLTAAGRIVDLQVEPDGNECDLLARALRTPGSEVPLRGFGGSDCRRCPAHLAAVPSDFDPRVSLL